MLEHNGKRWIAAVVGSMLLFFVAELLLSVRHESQTIDEAAHL